MNEIDGIEFNEAYPNKLTIDMIVLPISYISLDDLIKNKQVSGRQRDLSDITELNKLKSEK